MIVSYSSRSLVVYTGWPKKKVPVFERLYLSQKLVKIKNIGEFWYCQLLNFRKLSLEPLFNQNLSELFDKTWILYFHANISQCIMYCWWLEIFSLVNFKNQKGLSNSVAISKYPLNWNSLQVWSVPVSNVIFYWINNYF